ncbi:hypothetical protein ABPG75_005719 [Micractinium tetrahymenae]
MRAAHEAVQGVKFGAAARGAARRLAKHQQRRMLAKGCGFNNNPTACFTKNGHCGTYTINDPTASCCWLTTFPASAQMCNRLSIVSMGNRLLRFPPPGKAARSPPPPKKKPRPPPPK